MDATQDRAAAPASLVPDDEAADRTPHRVLSMIGAGLFGALVIALIAFDAPRIGAQAAVAVVIVACTLAHIALRRLGRRSEFAVGAGRAAGAGLPLLAAVTMRGETQAMIAQVVLALVFFQLLDALKPWPAAPLQDRSRGGAVAGDLVVGAYALGALVLALWFFERGGAG
jgi:hypothetical protein